MGKEYFFERKYQDNEIEKYRAFKTRIVNENILESDKNIEIVSLTYLRRFVPLLHQVTIALKKNQIQIILKNQA